MKNVVFCVLDAVMPARTGFSGSNKTTPFLDSLIPNSLLCSNVFAMGNPTEFAIPGIHAATNLFDFGGINHGITNRPQTFAEVLQEAGYETGAFFPIYRPFSHGYERGFNTFYRLYDINVLEKNFRNVTIHFKNRFQENSHRSRSKTIQEFCEYCDEYLNDLLTHAKDWKDKCARGLGVRSKIFENFDYDTLIKELELEIHHFKRKPYTYAKKILEGPHNAILDLIERNVNKRLSKTKNTIWDLYYSSILACNFFRFWRYSSNWDSKKELIGLVGAKIFEGQKKWVKYPSARFVIDWFKYWYANIKKDKPFYAFLHLLDAHEQNHYSYDLFNAPETWSRELLEFKKSLVRIAGRPNYQGNLLYDSAINYLDMCLFKLWEFLKREGLEKNTILVITSDHGGDYPNIPVRDKNVHPVDTFYDELYKVPLIISGIHNKGVNNNLISTVDIAPTILKDLDISSPKSFKGKVIESDAPRSYITFESQGRGISNLLEKPIKICVRSLQKKIVFQGYLNQAITKGEILEVYDLLADPNESINLSSSTNFAPDKEVRSLIQTAKRRLEEIRKEFNDQLHK